MKGSISTLILLVIHAIYGYPVTCPHDSHRTTRAEGFCENKTIVERYACLYDERSKSWKESCTEEADYVSPGRRYVISVNRKSVECPPDEYQPFKFLSITHSSCVFLKSTCSEEGQVLIHHGTSETDVVCRCDYRKGFTYVHSPKNKCDCDPSTEDCSCYRKRCLTDEIISQDYLCIPKVARLFPVGNVGPKHVCTEIQTSPTISLDMTTPTQGSLVDDSKQPKNRQTINAIILITAVLTLCISCILTIIFCWKIIQEKNIFASKEVTSATVEAKPTNGIAGQDNTSKIVAFKCRFCGKTIAESSSCISKEVTNATVESTRTTDNGIIVHEIPSNCDKNVKYIVFFTMEATNNVKVQVKDNLNQDGSFFKGYTYDEIICECTSQKPDDAPENWNRIGWKYTQSEAKSDSNHDVFYAFIEYLVLDDTCDILCNTTNCHYKIAKGSDISERRANISCKMPVKKHTRFSTKKDVLVQTVQLQGYDDSKDIITVKTANVNALGTCEVDCSNFKDFKFCKVSCHLCKQHIGWKHEPKNECPTQFSEFYVLILERLFDAKAKLE